MHQMFADAILSGRECTLTVAGRLEIEIFMESITTLNRLKLGSGRLWRTE